MNQQRSSIVYNIALAGDNIGKLTDLLSFRKLLQSQIFNRAKIAYGEIDIVGGVVGKRIVYGVQDFRPVLVEKGSESLSQFFL